MFWSLLLLFVEIMEMALFASSYSDCDTGQECYAGQQKIP